MARINIPVLTTAGYSTVGDLPGARSIIFAQHRHSNPQADHTLLVGPYDDGAMQVGLLHVYCAAIRGRLRRRSSICASCAINGSIQVFKGTPRPALVRLWDRVNFEVMGANEWRHASSLG